MHGERTENRDVKAISIINQLVSFLVQSDDDFDPFSEQENQN